jgi:hypothetical protein
MFLIRSQVPVQLDYKGTVRGFWYQADPELLLAATS